MAGRIIEADAPNGQELFREIHTCLERRLQSPFVEFKHYANDSILLNVDYDNDSDDAWKYVTKITFQTP